MMPPRTSVSEASPQPAAPVALWRDLLALTKPKVISLVVFTAICGLIAAPVRIDPVLGFTAILCIALGAGGAAALNQWWEADLDAGMRRTANRPLPQGRLQRSTARDFGIGICAASVLLMGLAIGWLAAAILLVSIFYYSVIYTIWLKPRTPQNIVIGGGAGAFPPLIGWIAATGHITPMPLVLFAIIFFWTPPHFWALALFVKSDYAKVGIPMMPVVAGEKATRRHIMGYAVLLLPLSMVPWFLPHEATGPVYGLSAMVLSLVFLALSLRVGLRTRQGEGDRMVPEKQLFAYSVIYLFLIFAALVLDRFVAF